MAEPVVLLHSLGLTGAAWEPQLPGLVARRTVLHPDLRGHGGNWDGAAFGIADMVDDLAALLDSHGAERAVLVGLSLGGNVAMTFAARHPGRVAALLLADCTPWYGEGGGEFWMRRAEGFEELGQEALEQTQLDRWFSRGFRERRPDEVARLLGLLRGNDRRGIAAACRALAGLDARPGLGAIAAPALVVGGSEDAGVTPEQVAGLAAAIPGSQLEILEGAGHLSLLEHPEVLAEAIGRLGRAAGPPRPPNLMEAN